LSFISIGAFIGVFLVLLYFALRKFFFKRETFAMDEIIKSLAIGFSISFCIKIMQLGIKQKCKSLDDAGNACLIIGGFALIVFALDGYYKSLKRED